jgi:hypothetical protein
LEIESFKKTSAELRMLADRLSAWGVTQATMESTGVFRAQVCAEQTEKTRIRSFPFVPFCLFCSVYSGFQLRVQERGAFGAP